ncbi:sulfatase-like hydrolase/transferase [Dyadobacter subterraneus]|uniref:Sulfatase-like hydrolase/transferase n=1 Tax=Dyadobacter subterraneus TaxID=2773304 RepID=A0ABR9W8R8_9BACT|nr:sulfatase-like hydrolase/transferase [Dyadobacter subterraneus]MBE9461544.1 sulfatase-like hydrolase/transferase [Dyadobacter subterraneus]
MNLINRSSGLQKLLLIFPAFAFSILLAFTGKEYNTNSVAKTPNIVVILADDMGYGDIKSFNPNSQIPTPNLDKLAGSGIKFTDAHSGSAVCSPTRYGLITGRYAFRSSLKKGVLGGYSPPLIEKDRFTIADLLKNAGYNTAVIGKWHLGLGYAGNTAAIKVDSTNGWPTGEGIDVETPLLQSPNDLGFDYSYIIPSSLDIPPYIYFENGKPSEKGIVKMEGKNSPRGVFWREGKASTNFKIEKTLDHFSYKASEFLTNSSKKKKPFFLYLPLTSPHTPWLPSAQFKDKSKAGIYGDFVAHTDNVVGKVLHTLDSLGLTENTLVIFTSDNGADWKPGDKKIYPDHQANYIFRGQKSDIWEGGHHVPFIASWPKNIRPNQSTTETICLTDLLATFASITGQKIPDNVAQDSFDFSILFNGNKSTKSIRKSIIHHSIQGMFAIKSGKWKYIDGQGSGGWSKDESATVDLKSQLYDLGKDPTESQNVVEEFPDIAKKLKAELDAQNANGFTRPGGRN